MDKVVIRAGSDLVLDAAVGGKPEPKVSWSKGTKELELCEKYALHYSSTRALAIIKFCDRDDTGKYVLTVKNASGTKTAEVNVKVLGKCAKHTAMIYLNGNFKSQTNGMFSSKYVVSSFIL